MNAETSAAGAAIFGWSPLWIATTLFVGTYVLIITEKINRAVVALLGAALVILTGVLDQKTAIRGIDFNTIGLLLGMMVIVGITGKCGVFQYVAIWSAKKVRARPVGILIMLSLVTALFSALLDNVTTVLLIVPVTLLITEELAVNVYPYLITEVLCSNIGGTSTLIGDPPNIMIGSATHLNFNDFLLNLAPIILVVLAATLLAVFFIYRKGLVATEEARKRVMAFREREAITDPRLLRQALFVLALVLIGFVLSHHLHLEPATIAITGAALLLFLDNYHRDAEEQSRNIHRAFSEAEWVTLFFFVGLFILVDAIDNVGVISWLATQLLALTGGHMQTTSTAVLWGSALLSGFVDNIPFVATMIPLIKSTGSTFGGGAALEPLWWSLALGACLGGNGTLIGASANLVVAGFAERAGQPIRFLPFFKSCFLLMILSIAISNVYVFLRYF